MSKLRHRAPRPRPRVSPLDDEGQHCPLPVDRGPGVVAQSGTLLEKSANHHLRAIRDVPRRPEHFFGLFFAAAKSSGCDSRSYHSGLPSFEQGIWCHRLLSDKAIGADKRFARPPPWLSQQPRPICSVVRGRAESTPRRRWSRYPFAVAGPCAGLLHSARSATAKPGGAPPLRFTPMRDSRSRSVIHVGLRFRGTHAANGRVLAPLSPRHRPPSRVGRRLAAAEGSASTAYAATGDHRTRRRSRSRPSSSPTDFDRRRDQGWMRRSRLAGAAPRGVSCSTPTRSRSQLSPEGNFCPTRRDRAEDRRDRAGVSRRGGGEAQAERRCRRGIQLSRCSSRRVFERGRALGGRQARRRLGRRRHAWPPRLRACAPRQRCRLRSCEARPSRS